ncbi:UNVERIFIED_CONTAM: hypothetical protein Sradi_3207800 [Sesamum radiatum]|uniref:K Homology domain-containing protein n=1 Tax=Sesamum radiatum TaxID=300843 RepID=A0AAW2RHT5_SESRA
MEETAFPSQKSTKSETTQKLKNHPSSSARGGGSKNTRKHHPTPPAAGEGCSNNTRKHHPAPPAQDKAVPTILESTNQLPPPQEKAVPTILESTIQLPPPAGQGGSNSTRKHHPAPPAAGQGGSNSTRKHHPAPPVAGQVAFRLLCHDHTAGGVIGSSGSVIKHLETLTGSKIRFEEGTPNCHERVINIVGDAVVGRKISVGRSEEYEMVDVSKAQEGLMRVFERVLEVEANAGNNKNEDNEHNSNGLITCRLLAPAGQIGALIGKRGKVVDGIRRSSGAKIRVFEGGADSCLCRP